MTPTPTTPLQASFTATPLSIHHPFPPKNFDHTQTPLLGTEQGAKSPRVDKSTGWRWYYVCPKRWLKTAKSCQCLSPKSGFFHFCCSPTKVGLSRRTGYCLRYVNLCPLFQAYLGLTGLAFCTVISWIQRGVANLCP